MKWLFGCFVLFCFFFYFWEGPLPKMVLSSMEPMLSIGWESFVGGSVNFCDSAAFVFASPFKRRGLSSPRRAKKRRVKKERRAIDHPSWLWFLPVQLLFLTEVQRSFSTTWWCYSLTVKLQRVGRITSAVSQKATKLYTLLKISSISWPVSLAV